MSLVCIDCRYISGRPSGIGELVQALVDHAPRLAPDLRFLLIGRAATPPLASGMLNVAQVTVRAAPNGPATMWWLPRLVDLRGVDLFHATYNILPAGLAMRTVTTVHDIMWLTDPQLCAADGMRSLRAAFMGHGIRRALARSSAIATVSGATRDAIIAHAPQAAARTLVTRSGVSSRFRPLPKDATVLAALGLDPSRRFLLTVGQYSPYKNHEGAVKAFAIAGQTHPDLDLVLVQRRGPDAQNLQALAGGLGMAGRVHVLREVRSQTLVELYSRAALLLHPSFREGFGNPLAEAMACGCPVVTSNVSAMPEVTDGAALYADPKDPASFAVAIGRVLADPRCAAELRQKGLERAAALRWEDFAAANVALYRRLLASAPAIA